MAVRPKRPCTAPGCGELVTSGKCAAHQAKAESARKTVDRERDKPFLHLYSTQWKKLRLALLREQPLCVECKGKGVISLAKVVDHITPHKGDLSLFWDVRNLRNLCIPCHSRCTAQSDGGFGNKQRVKA